MNKYIKILSLILILAACKEELVIDTVLDGTQSGAVLRTVGSASPSFISIPELANSTFEVTLEEQDPANGNLLERVDVFVSFVDNSDDNGPTTNLPEVFIEALPSSAFTRNDRGLPQISYSLGASEMVNALNLTVNPTTVTGSDQFVVRFALVLTDGRVFSSNNVAGIVSGSAYFRAPFRYAIPLVCATEIFDAPGDWVIEFNDSYGDGWNGAAIRVIADGVATDYTLDDGSSTTTVVSIPDGTSTLFFEFVSGDWDSEVTFTITSPKGNVVVAGGPSPAEGPLVLDLCKE